METHHNRTSWRNTRILGTLLLVFLCGAVSGALFMRLAGYTRQPPMISVWTKAGKAAFLTKFKQELNLAPDQAKEIEAVLDDFVMYYQSLQGQMDEVRADGKQRILRVLTPEQREKFERMLHEMQARLR